MAGTIRTIEPAEYAAWVAVFDRAIHLERPSEQIAEFRHATTNFGRVWGAFDDGRMVGTLRSLEQELTLPGGMVDADAVTSVGVLPTHRRQGILTRLMDVDLRAAAERGDPLSILIAAEYPIYGRFGYGAATEHATYAVDTARARFSRSGPGTMELVEPAAVRDDAQAVYERFRAGQPGAIARSARWWDTVLGLIQTPPSFPRPGLVALWRDPGGQPGGYVRYRVEGVWDERIANSTLVVDDLVATTPQAYARLWQYCCEIDLVRTVRAPDRSVQEALGWYLTDARAVRQVSRADFLWLRVLDVAAVLGRRRYVCEGRIVLEVVDERGLASGRFLLEGGPDGATCRGTSRSPDLSVPVASLGTLSLGGMPLRVLADVGRADEHHPGAVDRADAMFRSAVLPWCHTWF